jgi:hypothetical protein
MNKCRKVVHWCAAAAASGSRVFQRAADGLIEERRESHRMKRNEKSVRSTANDGDPTRLYNTL